MQMQKSSNMTMESQEPRLLFRRGSLVDVTTNEEGFKGSWYTATIIDQSPKSGPRARNRFVVEYTTLVTEGDSPEPLTECVHVSNLRPLPPIALTDHQGVLELNDVVEASYRDGWWTGVIVKVIDGQDDVNGGNGGEGLQFLVAFECPYEEIEFRLDELRLHFQWVHGRWVRSPKKEIIDMIEDTSETGLSDELDSVLTKVSTTAALPSSTMKSKRERTDSESIKPRKKLKKKSAEQALTMLTPCEFNLKLTKSSSEKADSNLDMHKDYTNSWNPIKNLDFSDVNVGNSNQMMKMGRKKLLQKFLTSLEGDEPIVEGEHMQEKAIVLRAASEAEVLEARGDFSAGTEKAPLREVFVVSEMDYVTPDLGIAIDKQGINISEMDNVTPDLGITIDKQGINISEVDNVTPDLETTIDKQGTNISKMGYVTPDIETTIDKLVAKISEMDHVTPDLETTIDKQGVCMSKALELCSDSRDQQENVMSCSAVIEQTDGTNGKGPSWPFVKSSGIWQIVDSMDIFTKMPQMPHFSPLIEYEENSRERLAICMMMKFAYEVDKIRRLSPHDLKSTSIIDDSLNSLKELESHGFDVGEIKAYCKDLLQEAELQEMQVEVERKIRKCKTDKTAAENKITEFVKLLKAIEEKLESAKSMKHLKDRELSNLESERGLLSGKIQSLQLGLKIKVLFSGEHSPHI